MKLVKLFLLIILIMNLFGCIVDEKTVIGEVSFPNDSVSEFVFELNDKAGKAIYIERRRPLPEIPQSILMKCSESTDKMCLIRELYGELKWKLVKDNKIVKSGDYSSTESTHQTILTLTYFTSEVGEYKLIIESDESTHSDAPISKNVIFVK